MTNFQEIIATTETLLRSRPARKPAHKAEILALSRLAEEMASHPENVLQTLCDEVLNVCEAESAGVSLITDENDPDFFWPAISGLWAQYRGGGMPCSASPCGVVIEHDRSLIFHDVEIQFPAAAAASPRIGEILLAPFRVNGRPIGTVWAIVHSNAKRFDREDRRALESLAHFAAAAFKMTEAVEAANEARNKVTLLNYELGHRIKNMLAMINAIASQTLKGVTERDAVEAFQNRLIALGSAQDILMDQKWEAAPLDVVADKVFAQLGQSGRITAAGPRIALGPQPALALALILHELVTNAIKYGALSVPDGRVSLIWVVTGDTDPELHIRWVETDGPLVQQPSRKGFGSRLIGMGLAGKGGAEISYPSTGVEAKFEMLLSLAQKHGTEDEIS
jgi:two-component sensor histidine kinase